MSATHFPGRKKIIKRQKDSFVLLFIGLFEKRKEEIRFAGFMALPERSANDVTTTSFLISFGANSRRDKREDSKYLPGERQKNLADHSRHLTTNDSKFVLASGQKIKSN